LLALYCPQGRRVLGLHRDRQTDDANPWSLLKLEEECVRWVDLTQTAILSRLTFINKEEGEEIPHIRVIKIASTQAQIYVPPTGIEPVHPPPEGGALSPELRGRKVRLVYAMKVRRNHERLFS